MYRFDCRCLLCGVCMGLRFALNVCMVLRVCVLAYCFGYCGVVLDCCVGFNVGFDSNCGFTSGFGCVVVLRCFSV